MSALATEVEAGLALVSIDVPPLPVFPALTGGVAVGGALSPGVDLGVRYTTWLGYDHRLGPELDVRAPAGPWTFGARVHPWLRVAGAAGETVAYGGDVSTQAVAAGGWAAERLAFTLELGATTQWLLFERLDGEAYVDGRPWLATVDVAAEVAWPDRWADALAVRVEAGIPRAPDDPTTVFGFRPRIVVVGRFGGQQARG